MLAKLARLAPVVTLVYDADNAGIKATLRASELLEKEGVQVRVVRLPPGDDPDSLLRRGDSAAFQRAIDTAVGRVEYQLERIVTEADQTTQAGRARMLRQIVAILASVPVRVERDAYIEKVWRFHPMSGSGPSIAKEMFHRDAEAYIARKRGESVPAKEPPPPLPPPSVGYGGGSDAGGGYQRRSGAPFRRQRDRRGEWRERPRPIEPPPVVEVTMTAEERAERELMRALASPAWRAVTLQKASPDDFLTPLAQRFFLFVQAHAQALQSGEADLVDLLIREEKEDFSTAVRQQLQEFNTLMANVPISQALIQGCLDTLRRHRKQIRLAELARFLQSKTTLTAEDQERLKEYHRLLNEVKRSSPPPPDR
jgi:DNA primase